jgi:hypothetical protein
MSEPSKEFDRSDDPIVAEVRAVRVALFAAAGNDIRELCRRARERQVTSGRQVLLAGDADTPARVDRSSDASRHTG